MTVNRRFFRGCAVVLLSALFIACIKVPYTDRRQFNLLPDGLMRGLGAVTYTTMLSELSIARKGENNKAIRGIGERIAKVADQESYNWEFALIRDQDTINAWCLPGGKIGVYTGLLPVVKNEAGLAFVMGHEVGHATAHHGAERLSQQLAVLGGIGALWLYLDDRTAMNDEQLNLLIAVLGVGVEVGVLLPFSRAHEKEADIIGMMYMAQAGYPPEESVKVWNRMQSASGGGALPSFLSTHPSHKNRRENLREWMPMASKRYNRSGLDPAGTLALKWKASDFAGSSKQGSTGQGSGKDSSGKKSSGGGSSSGGPPK